MKKCEESGHSDLISEIENDKMVFEAASRYYQALQSQEFGKIKEAGVLILKARDLIKQARPSCQASKKIQVIEERYNWKYKIIG